MRKYLVILLCGFSFASCQTKVDLSLHQVDRQFVIDSLHFERKVKTTSDRKDTTIVGTVDYSFPIFKDATLDWINDFIICKTSPNSNFDTVAKCSLKNAADLFLNDFENYCKENTFSTDWYFDASCNATYLNDSILKINISMEEYSGGAHPNHLSENFILDIKNKKQLALIDFLNNPKDTIYVRKVALQELRKMKNLKPNQKLDEDGNMFVDDQSYYISKNFDLDSANVSFFYNEYEIQAYAFGPVLISIPKVKLRKQIKNKFLN